MKAKLLFCFILLSVSLSTIGQTISVSSPEKCGLSADTLKTIDRVLNDYARRKEVAGGVALIARKGQIGYLRSFGMADIEADLPMTNDK